MPITTNLGNEGSDALAPGRALVIDRCPICARRHALAVDAAGPAVCSRCLDGDGQAACATTRVESSTGARSVVATIDYDRAFLKLTTAAPCIAAALLLLLEALR